MAGALILGFGSGALVGAGVGTAVGALIAFGITTSLNNKRADAVKNNAAIVFGLPCVVDNGFVIHNGVPVQQSFTALAVGNATGLNENWQAAEKRPMTFLDPLLFDTQLSFGTCAAFPSAFWVHNSRAAASKSKLARAARRSVGPPIGIGVAVGIVGGGIVGGIAGTAYVIRVFHE